MLATVLLPLFSIGPLLLHPMVQLLSTTQAYDVDFATASTAYLNRYPNPYAKHVLSSDTIETYVDDLGRLRTTRLVVKTGALPDFIKPFLGDKLNSWILEKSIIDPKSKKVWTYSANVDHRRFVKIEEYVNYDTTDENTTLQVQVRFSSNFIGFKKRIEQWSRDKFHLNLGNSREGFMYVMNKFQRPRWAYE